MLTADVKYVLTKHSITKRGRLCAVSELQRQSCVQPNATTPEQVVQLLIIDTYCCPGMSLCHSNSGNGCS